MISNKNVTSHVVKNTAMTQHSYKQTHYQGINITDELCITLFCYVRLVRLLSTPELSRPNIVIQDICYVHVIPQFVNTSRSYQIERFITE